MSTQTNTFTPLSLTDGQAKTIGSAAFKLFKKRLRDGRMKTGRGSQSALGLARTLADILKIDAGTGKATAEPETAGTEIVSHLSLRKDRLKNPASDDAHSTSGRQATAIAHSYKPDRNASLSNTSSMSLQLASSMASSRASTTIL